MRTTLEELRARFPNESDETLHKALAIINLPYTPLVVRWRMDDLSRGFAPEDFEPEKLEKLRRELIQEWEQMQERKREKKSD